MSPLRENLRCRIIVRNVEAWICRAAASDETCLILCTKHFGEQKITVVSPIGLESVDIREGCVVVTYVQGFSGVVEDIRRKERLAINLRRLAARCAVEQARLVWHGSIDSVQECSEWLSAEGLQQLWNTERTERALFSYPPMARLIKVIVDGTDIEVQSFSQKLKQKLDSTWFVRGPFLSHSEQNNANHAKLFM